MKTRPGEPDVQTATMRSSVGCTAMAEIACVGAPPHGSGAAGATHAPAGALFVRARLPLLKPTHPSTFPPAAAGRGPKQAAPHFVPAGAMAAMPASGLSVTPELVDDCAATLAGVACQPKMR